MRIFFPILFASALVIFVGLLQIVMLRLLNRDWWKIRWVRRSAWTLPLIGTAGVVGWGMGEFHSIKLLANSAAVTAQLALFLEVCLMLSLPISGLLHLVGRLRDRLLKRHSLTPTVDSGRRDLLKLAAASVPALAVSTGATGIARAMGDVRVYRRLMLFPNLPDELEGLKLFHLSDLHLHHYVTLSDLEQVLVQAEQHQPDLVLITGDVADDLQLLPYALDLISQLGAPLGVFASLGNHEYFRGIIDVRRHFDRSAVGLLVNGSIEMPVGKSTLLLLGIDDPRVMGGKDMTFYRRAIDQTMNHMGTGDFRLLMSHRPDALDYAAQVGIELTLAGHTHGGQVGLGGRSLFEGIWPERYLWGEYRMGKSRLYTSSGVGHWFPFRLGCPTEAPIIELKAV